MKQWTAQDILDYLYSDSGRLFTPEDALLKIRTEVLTAHFCFEQPCRGLRWNCYFLCSCVDTLPASDAHKAFEECPNCFGYGRPPIPPGEIGL